MFNIEETEKLLDKDINTKANKKAINRVKSSVYKKAALKEKRNITISRRFAVCAAGFAVIIICFSLIGFDNVAAAIGRMFTFIPGYGIVENNQRIKHVINEINEPISDENSDIILTVTNAITTEKEITIMFEVKNKHYSKKQAAKEKQEALNGINNGESVTSESYLNANGKRYKETTGYKSSSGEINVYAYSYEVDSSDINTDITYLLEFNGLSASFKLKDYESFDMLEQIGATGYNNDISITAVPEFKGNKLTVELYSINKSEYEIYSYNKDYDKGYLGEDLHLKTNNGIKKYTTPDGWAGANNKFMFEINSADKDLILNIPYIIVQSREEYDVTLPIPETGEKITVNKKIEFKDCTMIITDVEKTFSSHTDNYGELKLTLKYENILNNKIMIGADLAEVNSWGRTIGSAWGSELNDDGIMETMYFNLNENQGNKIKLRVYDPVYYFTDDYVLEIKK